MKKPPTLADVQRVAQQAREAGAIVAGCSYCARLTLKIGREPAPCPVCGAMVTARNPDDPRATAADKAVRS